MRVLEARFVHRPLDLVGEQVVADLPLDRRPARVPGERRGEHLVTALERGQDQLPGAPGVGEAMQAHQRWPRASTMRSGERRIHGAEATGASSERSVRCVQMDTVAGTRCVRLRGTMARLPPTAQPPHPSRASVPGSQDTATLRDGSELRIARITPRDAPLIADGFAQLSAESRRLRFLTSKPALSPAELRYLTEVDGHEHEALGAIDPTTGDGVAVARFVRDERDPSRAEVAITVADEWQHRGVGKLLLGRLADRAREERITRFTALVSGDNYGMQQLLNHQGAPVRVREIAGGAAEYEVELGPTGIGAQLEELLRSAAAGRWQMPPRVCDALRALVPIHFSRG